MRVHQWRLRILRWDKENVLSSTLESCCQSISNSGLDGSKLCLCLRQLFMISWGSSTGGTEFCRKVQQTHKGVAPPTPVSPCRSSTVVLSILFANVVGGQRIPERTNETVIPVCWIIPVCDFVPEMNPADEQNQTFERHVLLSQELFSFTQPSVTTVSAQLEGGLSRQ